MRIAPFHKNMNKTEMPLYTKWALMKQRCSKNFIGKKNYYFKGIKVCDRWKKFENFNKDLLETYTQHCFIYGKRNTQLDRINNNLGYYPKNCRWTTRKINNRNRSDNKIIEFCDQRKTLSEWSEITGIKINTIYSRIKRGWNTEMVLSEKIKPQYRNTNAF